MRIVLEDYDPNWPELYAAEAKRIQHALAPAALRIEHVGSTSVPGLRAKPVIDIQVSVASLHPLGQYTPPLADMGYQHISLPPPDDPTIKHADEVYPFFQKPPTWPSTHHVHLCAAGSVQERNHIVFRDYLRDHPSATAEYLALKEALAAEHAGDSMASRERYSLGKTDFVVALIEAAIVAGYGIE